MVREIIHIQVGQCGNQIGNIFWNTTCEEHHLDELGKFEKNRKVAVTHHTKKDSKADADKEDSKEEAQPEASTNPNPSSRGLSAYEEVLLDKIGVYYECVSELRYSPRAVLVDLEPGTLDRIKANRIGEIFKPDNFVMGASGCANNWAKGRFTEGLEVIDEIMDIIRKETEKADCVQAYQMCHSLAGGTGSGLGTLILNRIRDTYFDRLTAAFSVYPSPTLSDVVVEPYNTVLSVNDMIECADQSFTLDNEALVRILAEKKVSTEAAKGFGQYNELISYVMSGITSSLRFPGQLNGDLRKMSVNLVPFPRLHFFVVSQSPLLTADSSSNYTKITTQELTSSVLDAKSYYVNIDPEDGKFLTASVLYRGAKEDISTFEVDKEIAGVPFQAKFYGQFAEWIPNNFKYSLINIASKGWDSNTSAIVNIPMSATFVANHTAIKNSFQIFMNKFKALYSKKAFLHWYYEEGMDEDNFVEAQKNINDLICEYQEKTDVVVGMDNLDGGYEPPDDDEDYNEDDILAKYTGGGGGDDDEEELDDDLDFLASD
eukprot:CAMPEP_0197029492 /NCGR_PEP_ID=MMETSP1384-20130603/8929_1 /TAXON_ID=29189 /ORGANISM="Ammonia sp." /LENGTH=543 /DNA_ID=CAMNT_0042458669 /DNA_START=33 /DNA_END=1664 /DNA_ORIENTATION=-